MFKKVSALLAVLLVGGLLQLGIARATGGDNSSTAPGVAAPEARRPFAGSAKTLFAVVESDGSLARGWGVKTSVHSGDGVGSYVVTFRRIVTNCAFVANRGLSGSVGVSAQGEVTVVGAFGNTKGVYVKVTDSAGTGVDGAFHLVVACPPL